MPRLFTALPLPEAVRDHLRAMRGDGPDGVHMRWTDPSQYHITVRFIGEVDDEQARHYEKALSVLDLGPVRLYPYGFDLLPNRRRPRVFMVGFEVTEDLRTLYHSVGEALETVGLDPAARRYRPHVTLARLKGADARIMHQYLRSLPPHALDPFTVDALVLYRSMLTPDGAVYDRRASYALSASGPSM